MSTISQMTKDCDRDTCAIQEDHPATMTCMYWTPAYDKLGRRTDPGDPNITTHYFACRTCGAQWMTNEQYGQITIIRRSKSDLDGDDYADRAEWKARLS